MSDETRMEPFSTRLKAALNIRNITAAELAANTGLSKAQLSQYTNGKYEAKQKALYILAQALDVNEAWLMGYDVPMEKGQVTADTLDEWDSRYNPNGKLAKETQVYELIEEYYGADAVDAFSQYLLLDANDRAEIRGEMKHMLKSDKYAVKKESKNA